MQDRAGCIARTEDLVVDRMPLDSVHLLGVPFQYVKFPEGTNVKELDTAISAGSSDEVS